MADEPKKIPNIRTLKTDAEIFMKEKNISSLDIARSAYAAGGGYVLEPPRFSIYKIIAFSAVIVILLGTGGYFIYKFWSQMPRSPVIEISKPYPQFFPVEDERVLEFSEAVPGTLLETLKTELGKSLRFDTVIHFQIKLIKNLGGEHFLESAEFIKTLKWRPPQAFLDNTLPEFNPLIIYGQESKSLGVIFKVKNFERALASLFDWERTMHLDFAPFLSQEDLKNISRFSFQDEIIKNNDARVLKNAQGKIILGYVIFNKQYVIISTSHEGLETILSRLISLPPR